MSRRVCRIKAQKENKIQIGDYKNGTGSLLCNNGDLYVWLCKQDFAVRVLPVVHTGIKVHEKYKKQRGQGV